MYFEERTKIVKIRITVRECRLSCVKQTDYNDALYTHKGIHFE